MSSVVSSAIDLGVQILQLINTAESMKYVNQLTQAQLDLKAEQMKGYDADDAKIETLHGQIGILLQAVNLELKVFQSKAPVAPSPATH